MTPKQKAFVIEYIKDFNATRAALDSGYSPKTAYSIGNENLKKPEISAAIEEEYQKRAMSATEVLSRMSDIARGSAEDYLALDHNLATIDLQRMKAAGKLHLVKKFKVTKQSVEIELYDAQAALVQMGKQHGLFPNRQEVTGADGEPLTVNLGWGDNADA